MLKQKAKVATSERKRTKYDVSDVLKRPRGPPPEEAKQPG